MGVLRKLTTAGVLAAAMTTGALATDLYVPPTAEPAYSDPDSDWSGFYAGVYGAWVDIGGGDFGIGGRIGGNYDAGAIVWGAEANVQYYPNIFGGTSAIEGNGRLGFDAGPALIYGIAGFGVINNFGSFNYWTVGGGIEFKATDNLAIRGELKHRAITGGGPTSNNANIGVSYYFN